MSVLGQKEMYLNNDMCRKCGGGCCRTYPGCCMPQDFKDEAAVLEAIRSGRYCIDWWEQGIPGNFDSERAYLLRPSIKGCEGQLLHRQLQIGECTFLGQDGCELTLEERPSGCLLLEPQANGRCIAHGAGRYEAATEWFKCKYLYEVALEG